MRRHRGLKFPGSNTVICYLPSRIRLPRSILSCFNSCIIQSLIGRSRMQLHGTECDTSHATLPSFLAFKSLDMCNGTRRRLCSPSFVCVQVSPRLKKREQQWTAFPTNGAVSSQPARKTYMKIVSKTDDSSSNDQTAKIEKKKRRFSFDGSFGPSTVSVMNFFGVSSPSLCIVQVPSFEKGVHFLKIRGTHEFDN